MDGARAWTGWREATEDALYGPDGFYRRARPAAHFRTSVHASGLFAQAVLALARAAGVRGVLDVGAGGGELLAALHRLAPELALAGVEVASRPAGLPRPVGWQTSTAEAAAAARCDGPWLLVANEWLDDVPVDVAEADGAGVVRLVLVHRADGAERLGDAVTGPDAAWLARWWPLAGAPPGTRAEIGRPRDEAWAGALRALRRAGGGLALAVDYAHTAGGRPPAGTLTGFRAGREVPPVPDGSCDVTAHVALDACATAGSAAGASGTLLTTQRAALQALGLCPHRPPNELARSDPRRYLRALAAAGEAAELRDPHGLGAFGWLVQGVGVAVPGLLTRTPPARQ